MNANELATAFEKAFGAALLGAVTTPDEAVALRADRWVDLALATLRTLGQSQRCEIFPIRRGVGDLGWELVWGRNLLVDYAQLSRTDPRELFAIDLVAEVVEGSLRAGANPERAVEEIATDLGRLIWARAPLKVLFFGARRESEPANAAASIEAGLGSVIAARDPESAYLLVALPIFEASRHCGGDKAVVRLTVLGGGKPGATREVGFAKLLAS